MPTVSVGEPAETATAPGATPATATAGSGLRTAALILGVALLVVVVALQVVILNSVSSTSDDLVAVSAALTELDLDVASVRDQANALGDQLDGIQVAAAGSASSAEVPAQAFPPAACLPSKAPRTIPPSSLG